MRDMPNHRGQKPQKDPLELARRKEYAALHSANMTLQAKVRARDDLIAMVGHEIRNQMNTLQLHTELILGSGKELDLPAVLTTRLEALKRATGSFIRRATAMLEIGRLDSGPMHLDLEEVELGGLVRDLLKELEPLVARAGCSIEFGCERSITGIWDRMAIEQVALNLITNAIKYGAGKEIAVHLTRDGNEARLEVTDRGIGISDADVNKIFEPFERAVTRRQGGGFGLGLWISQRLVAAHHGSLQVKSYPSHGSVFTVVLPCSVQESR